MGDELTLEELARRRGEPVKRLRQWQSLGIIGAEGREEFGPEDMERTRLIQLCLRRGVSLETIAQAAKSGLLDRYVEMLLPSGRGRRYSLAEAAEIAGLELGLLRRMWEASGFTEEDEAVSEDDLEGIRLFKAAMEAGFPEDAMMQFVRVYADSLGRAAEVETRLFHFYIHERLKAEGLSGAALMEALRAAGERTEPLIEPMILYFHRKGWERAVREEAVMDLAEEAGPLGKADVPGQLQVAIAFVDLSSFTPLADAMGDVKAAQVLGRFSALVREARNRWEGRVVKQIGDAFMLVFPKPRSAVAWALEIEGRTAGEPQFPAVRSGVHWGTVLYREGDYVGSNVNIASRLAAEAQRHQVLVTAAVRNEVRELAGVEFVPLGKRRLKGLADEVDVFEARPRGVEGREKAVDPVCGVELGPAEVAARLALEGKEWAFCSEECLRRFVAAPERYLP